MADATISSAQTGQWRLIDQVNDLKSTLARDMIRLTDMSRAGSLETGIGTDTGSESLATEERRPVDIVRLEGRIVGRAIEVDPPS